MTRNASCRSSTNVPRLPSFLELLQSPHVLLIFGKNPLHAPRKITSEPSKVVRACGLLTFWLGKVLRATTAYTFSASQLPKVLGGWGVLYILTWKCASRYKSVHFFNISTSKSALNVVCFVHFDLEMCFAPQRRALFRRLNFQKCSETVSFNTFDFELFFAPQRRATFHLSLIWPAALASLLFDPREPQIMGKSTFSTFSRAGIFFLLTLSPSLLSSALLFYDSSHLCFSICPYCRKFDF